MNQLLLKKTLFGLRRNTFFLMLWIPILVTAQFYNTGSAPYSVKWQQIKTPEFQLIFPEENFNTANDFAYFLSNTIHQNAIWFDSVQSKRLKIILYNQNTISNGYVSLAPKRMELITTPPQKSYAQDWMEQLALHEYRHVIQLNSLNQGITKTFHYALGEIAPGAISAFLPLWFLEGDAVVAETSLSSTGRGREPDFMKEIKAIEIQKEHRLTYDQAYLGTYQGLSPDHYRYGYQMVAYAYSNYGKKVFNNTLNTVARKPFLVAPFYFGLKNNTSLSKVQLYDSTFNYLSRKWKNEQIEKATTISGHDITTTYKSEYVNYLFPFLGKNGEIVALRTSIDDVSRFVSLKDNKESNICLVGSFNGDQVAYSEKYIAWEELNNDIRWEQKNSRVIRIYDRYAKTSFVLKKNTRHFSPSFNTNGTKLAVIRNDLSNRFFLEIYSLKNKNLEQCIEPTKKLELSYNTWINDTLLAVVAIGTKGKSIYLVSLNTHTWTETFGPTSYNITHLNYANNKLAFTYTLDGSQNIYTLDLKSPGSRPEQITNVPVAADYGYFGENQLVFADYGYKGFKVKVLNINNLEYTTYDSIKPFRYDIADNLNVMTGYSEPDTTYIHQPFKTSKYSRVLHALNIHSWLIPFYFDVLNNTDISSLIDLQKDTYWGFNLFSQNILSTVTSSFGYYYKNGYHHIRPTVYFTGLYPKISLEMDLGGSPIILRESDTLERRPADNQKNREISINFDFPFDWSTSRYYMLFNAGISLAYNNIYIASSNKSSNYTLVDSVNGTFFYRGLMRLDYNANYFVSSLMSAKDIYPKWGLNVYVSALKSYKSIPYHNLWESNLFIGTVYLPGFLRHHSAKIRFSTENGLADRVNDANLPRGFQLLGFNYARKTKKYSFDYTLPLFYPDISVGPLAYFKRVQSTVFIDYMQYQAINNLSDAVSSGNLYSYGAEIGVETHFLRFFAPFTPVFRYSYMPQKNSFQLSFFVNSSLRF
jgi:hypothetical protein